MFDKDWQEHQVRLEQVLDQLKRVGLKLNPEKCQVGRMQVVFLGGMWCQEREFARTPIY